MRRAFEEHDSERCYVFDEWSSKPLELQPYAAEMLRKLFFGLPKVTVRIGAIPHRTEWRISKEAGDYVGVEVGAELFVLLDLDEFVVFPARSREEQATRTTDFFKNLLHRHLSQILTEQNIDPPADPDRTVSLLFTRTRWRPPEPPDRVLRLERTTASGDNRIQAERRPTTMRTCVRDLARLLTAPVPACP